MGKCFEGKKGVLFALGILLVFASFNTIGQTPLETVVVTFGNSTTAPRKNIEKVYAVRLMEKLLAKGMNIRIINAGTPSSHSGSIKDNNFAKLAHGMDRFDSGVLRYKPDWVTINFGLNDSWQDSGEEGSSRIPVAAYRKNLLYYINKIQETNGRVILLTPNPVGKKFYGYHKERLKQYRQAVIDISKEKNVALIDSWKLFNKYVRKNNQKIDTLLLDGIHPGDTGHELIAREIAKIIIRETKKIKRIK